MNLCHQDKLYKISENQDITIYKNNEWKTYTILKRIGHLETQTYCVLNYIKVLDDQTDVFESNFLNKDSHIKQLDGFVALRILRPKHPDNYYLIITLWESEAHFKMWCQSKQYQDSYRNTNILSQKQYNVIDPDISYRIKFNIA
ncbi:antibiotic biosynthesis monooxygenase [Staphylococcus felis]|uniref:Signal transduction protein TRAP n=1 Tax=Staphylococcus felis TaxID=46127 RepID=A0A2K3ZIC5_9STAP|nr:antibiotic biosynthesis monooxygenase [Staphylococcus felis]AVP35885.1 antibiotic biosynthesis monooxygenase [Staphylococcus felis]MBH9581230.1 antibiotic biosynthesis monooxygenase [Staphylococcus felis]MDM8328045.1 antibiotic biosynthesis monooxygenase [Staphylococcus felis]MDQ7192996.1 antibiotic biosynthesis monooxygenase [Staphylococcus felis]PNZ37268.1 antibiotic biosynthesis monooxygenase [Staphylococcus felis]